MQIKKTKNGYRKENVVERIIRFFSENELGRIWLLLSVIIGLIVLYIAIGE